MPPKDQNHVPAKMGVLFSDGVTLVPIAIDSVTGGFKANVTDTIGFVPGSIDFRSDNYRPCWMAQNSVDGTPIPIFVDADGAILIDT